MNLGSLVKQGRLPWRPNDQVSDLEVWHQYEIPLTGVFSVGEAAVLFTQVYEYDDEISVWAYIELPSRDLAEVADRKFKSSEDLTAWVEKRFVGRTAVLALAREDRLASQRRHQPVESNLLDATDAFLTEVLENVPVETRVRAKMAGVDVARAELPEDLKLLA
jgi:hypothetical protein